MKRNTAVPIIVGIYLLSYLVAEIQKYLYVSGSDKFSRIWDLGVQNTRTLLPLTLLCLALFYRERKISGKVYGLYHGGIFLWMSAVHYFLGAFFKMPTSPFQWAGHIWILTPVISLPVLVAHAWNKNRIVAFSLVTLMVVFLLFFIVMSVVKAPPHLVWVFTIFSPTMAVVVPPITGVLLEKNH